MVPNCGVFTKRSGVPRLTWFKALKNSARNWNFIRSTRLNSRASAKSIVWRPGPMTVLRPTSPKVKAGGVEKAFGLNHSDTVCVTGPKMGWPVGFARMGFWSSSVAEFEEYEKTENVECSAV